MPSHDLHHNIQPEIALNSTAISSATTTTGASISTQFFEAVEFILRLTAWSSGTATPLLEDSPDGMTWTAVDAQFLLGPYVGLVAADTLTNIGYIGMQPFVRMKVVTTGGSVSLTASGQAILGVPHTAPTDQTPPPM